MPQTKHQSQNQDQLINANMDPYPGTYEDYTLIPPPCHSSCHPPQQQLQLRPQIRNFEVAPPSYPSFWGYLQHRQQIQGSKFAQQTNKLNLEMSFYTFVVLVCMMAVVWGTAVEAMVGYLAQIILKALWESWFWWRPF